MPVNLFFLTNKVGGHFLCLSPQAEKWRDVSPRVPPIPHRSTPAYVCMHVRVHMHAHVYVFVHARTRVCVREHVHVCAHEICCRHGV